MNKHASHKDYICANHIRSYADAFGYFSRYSIRSGFLLNTLLCDWIKFSSGLSTKAAVKATKCKFAAIHLIEKQFAHIFSRTLQAIKQNEARKALDLFYLEDEKLAK